MFSDALQMPFKGMRYNIEPSSHHIGFIRTRDRSPGLFVCLFVSEVKIGKIVSIRQVVDAGCDLL
jgi:hypothetical protein